MILNKKFSEYVSELPLLTEGLRSSAPLTLDQIACLNSPSLSSFSEDGKVLYIGRTEVRFFEVSDHNLQHLLELYASMELNSAHNTFETS